MKEREDDRIVYAIGMIAGLEHGPDANGNACLIANCYSHSNAYCGSNGDASSYANSNGYTFPDAHANHNCDIATGLPQVLHRHVPASVGDYRAIGEAAADALDLEVRATLEAICFLDVSVRLGASSNPNADSNPMPTLPPTVTPTATPRPTPTPAATPTATLGPMSLPRQRRCR